MIFKAVVGVVPTLLLLLLLFTPNLSFAAAPFFAYPDGTSPNAKRNVTQAFRDAITLARVVSLTATDCDPAFLRYFKPQDYTFVQRMFRTIANIDPFVEISPVDIMVMLSSSNSAATWNPDYVDLCIAYGDNPYNPPVDISCGEDEGHTYGYTVYDTRPTAQFSGLISMCPDGEIFKYCLSLRQTENPPAWARVGGQPDGAPLPGFGCDGLGDRDTTYMKVLGSSILHELFHWPWMFLSIPGYETNIPDHGHRIWDYDGPWVPSAYGPWNAMHINQLPADSRSGMSQSLQNADNYVWYALSRYWSYKCDKTFGPPTSADDATILGERQRGPGN
ncbi:uncharacterized protein Z520_06753 [Fonsecaea multimorphosa CBS 102226]|uniref:Lysine-specific metallo-endopeptidase domain-containing protein n=1 Tax=Fonsecaea multimorphosa CBS 102226 TaxID=1442371 RepID=A0A0D2IJQ8_9EURO|nr:uncharacterized protein Z520_06753 [Fonsecaea multimorphosa CBS 102226]KIX97301.1 hypothetical protein Z520_06753 [Fonsecaea multimorphosa CBS 102226]OAL23269.1 hypothetical protein AYO22_06319 [Fonsecaea multimorphosa]